MKTKWILLLANMLAALNVINPASAQPFFVDCSCLATQSVLMTNACQAVIPDLCQFTNCWQSTVVPPPVLKCSQTPPAGTLVGPGIYTIILTITDPNGVGQSCGLNFTNNPPSTGCGPPFMLLCATNKTVECGSGWSFDPPTWTNACVPPPGTPSNGVTLTIVSTVTNGTCPMVITRIWQGVDDCANSDHCSQTVTVVDTTPPVLDCKCLTNSAVFPPVPLTVIACSTNIPDLCQSAQFCATDNCGPLTCSQSPLAGAVVGPGSYPITVTVSDCASNTASCVLTFTVIAPAGGCTTNPCVTPPSGMVAWWPLDELTGASLFVDATGNGHTAIVESGGPVGSAFSPTAVPGKVAGANYFYGLSPRGRALNTPTLNFNTNSFSMDCWVNPVLTGVTFWHPIVDKLNQTGPATGVGYAVGILNTKVVLKVGDGTLYTYTSLGSASYSLWNFVAVVVNRAANTVTFHVNGVTEAPQALTPAGNVNSAVDLLIGSTYNAGLPLGELAVDELELFNRTLTINEMNALWVADSVGKCKTNSCIVSIFCPSDIVATRSCTQTCATVTYPAPLLTNGVLTGCTPPSGTCFPLGTTLVTCTATNACGQPAACNFTITVNASTNCQPCDYTLAHRLYSGSTLCLLPTGALEPLWVNTAAPGGPIPMVVVDTNLWPIAGGPWIAPSAQSAWVGPSTSSQGPAGWYTNRWTFDAPCTNVCLRGRFATDDDGYLYVNGNFVAGPSVFTAWTPVYVCSGFSVGPNTIELVVHNAGGPTGFRTELEIWTQCCTPCASQTNVWNTGMGGPTGNVPLSAGTPDPNYLLVSQPPGGCTGPAQVLLPGSLPGVWVPNGPNSQWIGAGPTANCQGGVYHYRLCFYLPCADGASIIGQWTADDWAGMYLNGLPTGNTVPSTQFPNISFAGWHPVQITNGFVCGNNTLDFYVTNAWTVPNPTGLRAQLTNVFNNCCTNCTPQPCSCGLTNGDFSQPVPVNGTGGGWTSSGVFAGNGWQATGGNPGGTFLLNNVGDPATDPTISQRVCCLVPGQCYTIRGQRKVQAWYGQTAPSFAVLVDGVPILTLPVPTNPADTNWHDFSVSFTATNACQTIGFAAEINGTDVSYWIDNIRLECCNPNCHVSIKCPNNLVLLTCNPSAVGYYAVGASGNTSPVICTPPSGSSFPLGSTVVICTATNTCGADATCSFTVFVKRPPNRWDCWWQAGLGISYELVGNATALYTTTDGSPDDSPPTLSIVPDPGTPNSGALLHPGPAQAITFTAMLDFTAPVGAGFDLVLPPDPGHPNQPPILSLRNKGKKGYCVKTMKFYDDDPSALLRAYAVNTNGDLLDPIAFTFAEIDAAGVLDINFQPGVENCHVTIELDLKTGAVSVEIPGPIAPSTLRKGWDGLIYGPDRPVKKPTSRVTMIPPMPPGLPPITDLYLYASGLSELAIEEPSLTAKGRPWGDGHVTLIKAYDDGESVEFAAVSDGGGVHVDLGHAESFDLRLTKFENNLPTGEQLLTRTLGPIRGLTNRPPPPFLDAMLLQSTADGVDCSADFSNLDSPTVHVLIYNGGNLVAERAGVAGLLGSPLFTLPEWPQTLGKLGGATPCRRGTIRLGTIRLPGGGAGGAPLGLGLPPLDQFVVGDEFRVLAEMPPGAPHPDYYSGFEFIATDGADWGISGLQRNLACAQVGLHIERGSDGVLITWPDDSYRLQGAEDVNGPWFDLGASSPVSLDAIHTVRFFRLACD